MVPQIISETFEMIPIAKAVEFLKKHNICIKWSDEQLHSAIVSSALTNALAFETDANCEEILSLCFGVWTTPNTFHVTAIAGKDKVKNLLLHLKDNYPDCQYITGLRREVRPRRFEVSKLLKKFKLQ